MKHELVGDRWNPEDSRLYNSGYEMGYAQGVRDSAKVANESVSPQHAAVSIRALVQTTSGDELIRDTARKIIESVSLAYQADNSRVYLDELLAILNEFASASTSNTVKSLLAWLDWYQQYLARFHSADEAMWKSRPKRQDAPAPADEGTP